MSAKNVQARTTRRVAKATRQQKTALSVRNAVNKELAKVARRQKRFDESDIRLARAVVADARRRDRHIDDTVEQIASLPLQEDRVAG